MAGPNFGSENPPPLVNTTPASCMIATPLRGRSVNFEYVVSMLQSNGAYRGWMPLSGQGDIYVARNTLTNAFLRQSDAAHLVFIDGDIGWSRQNLLDLVATPHPVVSGLYPGHGPPEWICRDEFGDKIPVDKMPRTGLLKSKLVGCGFLKISRIVLQAMIDQKLAAPYGGNYQFFKGDIEGDFLLSEDYSFSKMCRQAGFQPMLNCEIRLMHDGKTLP